MHLPGWLLAIICSYLKERSLILKYMRDHSEAKTLPGGFSAGTWLGGLLFIVKFNGACLRPPIPRPISLNEGIQLKYIDDASQIASINLKKSLIQDTKSRQRPLKYSERTGMVLNQTEDILQQELDKFFLFTEKNKLLINRKKCFVMKFTRSRKYDFPPEFTIGGSDILEVKTEHKILGVMVQSDGGWGSQCQEMVRRATSTTWAIRRMKALGVSEVKLTEFWKSEGRVHLEYACPVWHSSLTAAQSKSLDRAQRVAMAAITGRWLPSHTQQLLDLGLDRLGPRRDLLCKRFAERTARDSRHQDLFNPVQTNTRMGTQGTRYTEIRARTSTYYKSALPYLTRVLNQQ